MGILTPQAPFVQAMVDGFAGLVGGKAKVHWTTSMGFDVKTMGFAGWEFGLVHEVRFMPLAVTLVLPV